MRGKRGTYRKRRSDAGMGRATLAEDAVPELTSGYVREFFRQHGLRLQRVGGALRAVYDGDGYCVCHRPSKHATKKARTR